MQKTASQIADEVLTKIGKEDPSAGGAYWAAAAPAAGASIAGGLGALGLNLGTMSAMNSGEVDNLHGIAEELLKDKGRAGLPIEEAPTVLQSSFMPDTNPEIDRRIKHTKRLGKIPKVKGMADWDGIVSGMREASKPRLNLPQSGNPFIAAHEVGHATGSRLGLGRAADAARRAGNLGSAGILVKGIYDAAKGNELGDELDAAPWLSGAANVPRQLEELRATTRGVRMLKGKSYSPKHLLGRAALQQLGYLAGHAVPVGVSAAAVHGLKSYADKTQPDAQSSEE